MADQPATQLDARLHVVAHESGQTRQFPIGLPTHEGGQLVIGRSRNADLTIHDDYISNSHLRISFRKGKHWAEDLGSTHGTELRGQRISKPVQLESGDTITLGRSTCEYRCVERTMNSAVTLSGIAESSVMFQDSGGATGAATAANASGAAAAASSSQPLASSEDLDQRESIVMEDTPGGKRQRAARSQPAVAARGPGFLARALGVFTIAAILALIGYLGWRIFF